MIGQTDLVKQIKKEIKEDDFPRFSIIVGPKGSGKKTLTDMIIKQMSVNVFYHSAVGVSQVRDAIDKMYKTVDKSIFTFYDADDMSIQAKNALLKVAEETPNNVHIIMTVKDLTNVLDTIKSRANIYFMQRYSRKELIEYAHKVLNARHDDEIIQQLCDNPGEINMLYERDAEALWDYAYKAINNVAEVSGANAFKMANKIDFTGDEEDKFDMLLFLKAFMSICSEKMSDAVIDGVQEDIDKYGAGLDVTCNITKQLYINGINKKALFDMWILDIRKAWM